MRCILFLAVVTASAGAFGAERPGDAPLVVNGELSLTTTDFEAYAEKVPDKLRGDFRADIERVKPTVDSLWVYRLIAKKARDAGLADDPLVAARATQAVDMVLAEAYFKQAEARMVIPDLAPRAREIYNARLEEFRLPEQVHVQHILVNMNDCRSPDQALQRAKEIRARLEGADEKAFAEEALNSSDDPSRKKNKGDLGLVAVTTLDPPFAEGVAKLKVPGQISEPIESRYGYHIVRFVERQPGKLKPFEEVKDALIAAERQKLIDAMRTAQLNAARNDPGNYLYMENVRALTKGASGTASPSATKP
jgi:peptidyl-prolyl cis-trans isomerase C